MSTTKKLQLELERTEKEEDAITAYQNIYHKCTDLFLIAAEPVWYLTVLFFEYLSIWIYLYTNVDTECHNHEWYNQTRLTEALYVVDALIAADILLSLCGRICGRLNMVNVNLNARPLWIIVIEIMSLIPSSEIVTLIDPNQLRLICIIAVTKVVRYIRVYYFFHRLRALFYDSLYTYILKMLSNFSLVVLLVDNFYCNLQCCNGVCSDEACLSYKNLVRLAGEMTTFGQYPYVYTLAWNIITGIAKLFVMFLITNVTIAFASVELIQLHAHQVSFVQEFNAILNRNGVAKRSKNLQNQIASYYVNVWQTRGGYVRDDDFPDILPSCMQNELRMDINWNAYKHSNLLRYMELTFLRELSSYMKQVNTLPGEIIFGKNELKDQMIYVVSGTIQLLSEEDGESPILAFTTGTCLGESTLIVSYKARAKVRSKDYCELSCLRRKDLLEISKKYPKEVMMLQRTIMERYQLAKQLKSVSDSVKSTLNQSYDSHLDVYTTVWLKNTLHKLMSTDRESSRRHEFQNIYLVSETNASNLNKLPFTARFLNSMVISERIDLDMDTVFVKPTCLCILRPCSFIVYLWETFILALTVYVSFIIPYSTLISSKPAEWYRPVVSVTTFIFWIDLYIQLSIAVVSKGVLSNKFATTARAKLATVGTWLDFLSCLPCEILTCITLSGNNLQWRNAMHLNRLAKLWRVERFFRNWENVFGCNFVVIRFAKFTWINLYAIFIFWCCFHKDTYPSYLFIAIETLTGTAVVGVPGLGDISKWLILVAILISWIITLFMRSNIISAFVLVYLNKFEVQLFCEDVINTMVSHSLDVTYKNRVYTYLMTQWIDNHCLDLLNARSQATSLPTALSYNLFVGNAKNILMNEEFFKMLPLQCVLDLAGRCTRIFTCSPNDVILYGGDMTNTAIIIYHGTYEVRDSSNASLGFRNTQTLINFVEAALRTTAVNTYVAISYVKVILMEISTVEEILSKYDTVWSDYKETVLKCKDIKKKCLLLSEGKIEYGYQSAVSIQREKSFFNFGYNLVPDSWEEYDYYIPFDKIYPFSPIRYFLMRVTILPNGRFLMIWEIFRCLFAVLSNILYFITPIVVRSRRRPILICLDITAILDIYLRLHIAFYNSKGLLIKHPLYTARYYLSNGFMIDCLAILPISLLISSQSLWFYIFASNRLLQLHRYLHFIVVLHNRTLKPVPKYFVLIYLPLFIVIFNFFGNWLVTIKCVYLNNNTITDNYFVGLKCTNESILATSHLEPPVTHTKAHLYGTFIAAQILLNMGVEGYNFQTEMYLLVAIMSLVGYYMKAIFVGKLFTLYSSCHSTLLSFQEEIRSLKSYLEKIKVNPSLSLIIVDSYEYKWSCMRGKNIHHTMAPFYHTLSTDVLYAVFGESLYENSVFENKVPGFYRNLIEHMKHDVIKAGGYLTTINDITEHLHILYSGRADILAPDGATLDYLISGSIFGNLENKGMARLRISVVAVCHVEILSVPASVFHNILQNYPKMVDEYRDLKLKYLTYIPHRTDSMTNWSTNKLSSTLRAIFVNKTFNPNSKFMECWSMFNLVYTCYVGIIIDLYLFGSLDYSTLMIFVQVSSDVLYLIQFLMKQRTAYENEAGMLVTDLKMIKRHNRKEKILFVITIISLIPLDFPVAVFVKRSTRKFHWISLTRCNRLLRLTYIFQYFDNLSYRLNIKIIVVCFSYIFVWSTLFLCGLASLISFTTCYFPHSAYNRSATCSEILEYTWMEKFKLYTDYFYIAISWFIHCNTFAFYPREIISFIVYTLALLACMVLNALCLSQIFSVVSQCTFTKSKYKDLRSKLKIFLDRKYISVALVKRILGHVELLWLYNRGVVYPTLLKESPSYLRDIISYDAFAHLVINHAVFKKCHRDCMRQIIQSMKTEIHFSHDYVQFKDAIDETMYFIFSGEINVIEENPLAQDLVIRKLGRNRSFGILQGIYDRCPHTYTYQASKTTVLVTLTRKSWVYLLDYFPASREQLSRSNSREVTLTGVDRKTSGEYKCEVSADAPLFHTEIRAAHLLVADIPDEGPVLRTDILKAAPGATITANCTTPGSYPPMNVTWFVNDVEVQPRNETEVLRIIEIYEALPGLETVRSIYTMRVQQSMFKNGKIKLRCLATMFTLYRRTKEVELQEDAPLLALVMEPTPHGNKGYSSTSGLFQSNLKAYFWSIFTATCVMLCSRRFNYH
ncbi:hypothetical protein Trydic_g22239 [Trypoxylus dichotomus]